MGFHGSPGTNEVKTPKNSQWMTSVFRALQVLGLCTCVSWQTITAFFQCTEIMNSTEKMEGFGDFQSNGYRYNYVYTFIYTCISINTCIYICIHYIYKYSLKYLYVYIYMFMYLCIYFCIQTHPENNI